MIVNESGRICLIFGVEALKEFNKFRMPIVFPGGCRCFRALVRHKLRTGSVMMMPFGRHVFFMDDIFLINGERSSSFVVLAIEFVARIFESVGVVKVSRLNLLGFHILFHKLSGLANLIRRF
jgi:hypothetical protein